MKKLFLSLALAFEAVWGHAQAPKKLLVVTVTTGYRHSSIPVAERVLSRLAAENGRFTVDFVRQPAGTPQLPLIPRPKRGPENDAANSEALKKYDAAYADYEKARAAWLPSVTPVLSALSPANLARYDGVLFASTTGDLPLPDPEGFIAWVRQGHAFIGVHAAADTFHGFPAFIGMIGGEFRNHGAQVSVDCLNQDRAHPACNALPESWTVFDEIYQFKNFDRTAVHMLLSLDRHPNEKTPGFFPVAWCKRFGTGRIFYTSLGHREDVWDDTFPGPRKNAPAVAKAYQQHLLGGILWALGLATGSDEPQAARAAPVADRDWPDYLGGPDRGHYSPLAQIDTANVGGLVKAWEYHTGDFGQMESSPLVVRDRLFGVTAMNDVFALDAATGAQLWRHAVSGARQERTLRGVAYWEDAANRRILFTVDSWLYALDAESGRLIGDFGNGGKTSLKAGLGPQAAEKWVVSTTPGTVFEDLIIMPTRVSETQDAAPGYIQAFNVRTGKLVWTFHTIPFPGEKGYETWPKDAYKNYDVGAANCWAGMALDRDRGLLFVPTGSASPDFWGGSRKGQNLFADCLLALDVRTGRLVWHYQLFHHDLWDRDPPAPPSLLTIHRDGRAVDAVAQVTKSGYVFVFERATGKPLFPIRETPVPPSDLPGEEAWPTQPIPVQPAPFARQAIGPEDASPYAENRGAILNVLRSARRAAFQPFSKEPTVLFPGFDGGGEWGGAAVDPDGVLYVNANEIAWLVTLSDAPKPGELAQLSPGRRLYTLDCIACHGPERQGIPASGIPTLVDIGRRRQPGEIEQLISTGKGMMPGFPNLSQIQKQAIVAYLFGEESEASRGSPVSASAVSGPGIPYKFDGYWKILDSKGYPGITPPWGSLSAIDLNTGRFRWHVSLGEFKELTDRGIPPTGCESYGGPVVTAGGLLFIAATKDGMFRAFDRKTGVVLWQAALPAGGFATPCTYAVGGRQFVAVACGGTKLGVAKGDSYVSFALPP